MNKDVSLSNKLMRDTYRLKVMKFKYLSVGERSATSIRAAIKSAHRFVLDDSMSAFLADLSSVPFQAHPERRGDVFNSIRHSARLPYPLMWIEFDGRAFRKRLLEHMGKGATDVFGRPAAEVEETFSQIGWLLEQDPVNEMQIKITEYFDMTYEKAGEEIAEGTGTLPFTWHYRCDDARFQHAEKIDTIAGMLSHGISGHHCEQTGVRYIQPLDKVPSRMLTTMINDETGDRHIVHALVAEYAGVLRYAISFLACMNDIPTTQMKIAPAGGYIGDGQRRGMLDHTELRLVLPKNVSVVRLAKRLIVAVRKRWHEVRPHHRHFFKHEGVKCKPKEHIWTADDASGHSNCINCTAWRVWIVLPKGRGDKNLGTVTHDETQVSH